MQKQSLMRYVWVFGIYGLNPSSSVLDLPYRIRPALSAQEDALVHVKTLPAGQDGIYGATYTTTTDKRLLERFRLAMRMVGPEILPRRPCCVDGQLCLLLGVSMDQDYRSSSKSFISLGTPVTLMGENGGANICIGVKLKNVVLSTTKFFVYLVTVYLVV